MRMAFTVDIGDGPVTVVASPLAIIGYEVANRTKISRIATEGFGIVDMTELVWRQLVLENRYGGDLDTFRHQLRDIDPVVDADPT